MKIKKMKENTVLDLPVPEPTPIKAISLWQPWASLKAANIKLHETRHWKTDYRGPIAIHAAKTRDFAGAPDELCAAAFGKFWSHELPLGAVLAVGTLVSCKPAETVADHLTRADRVAGNFAHGRWAWRIEDVRALAQPIPLRGRPPLLSFNHGVAEWSFGPEDRDSRGLKWWRCPYGAPGDLLWVKERCWIDREEVEDLPLRAFFIGGAVRFADGRSGQGPGAGETYTPEMFKLNDTLRSASSIHMPRWASRLTLEIAEVRVERLHDITDADAEAEGIREPALGDTVWSGIFGMARSGCPAKIAYAVLWDGIHGERAWDANPWVWAVSFKVHQDNVDELGAE